MTQNVIIVIEVYLFQMYKEQKKKLVQLEIKFVIATSYYALFFEIVEIDIIFMSLSSSWLHETVLLLVKPYRPAK
jgi:hypothetical protein